MVSRRVFRLLWWVGLIAMVTLPLAATAQQATKSDTDLVREGPAALAAAHGSSRRSPAITRQRVMRSRYSRCSSIVNTVCRRPRVVEGPATAHSPPEKRIVSYAGES